MVSKTNELALEQLLERSLTGTTREELADQSRVREQSAIYQGNGYEIGYASDFDSGFAIDARFFWQFLRATQQDELDKLQKGGDDWQRKVLERFDRLAKKHGILDLLKKGLAIDDAHLQLMYPPPLASSGALVQQNFAANIFSCTRQVPYSRANPREEIDVVLFINGLPFATLELKNPWTGQSARVHGQRQYRQDRDQSQTLLQFGRCLVHMAVDTDEVYMTTKLAGAKTFFLPFNQGYNHGAGNPPNLNGHKTAYLWEQVLSRSSVANIIEHFMRLGGSAKDKFEQRTLFFPRYHQLDVVRKLIAHTRNHGVGHTYLIQHSAGSGKSNSITWAAYQLIEVYPGRADLPGARGLEQPLFDSVIVVTDRRILDRQLRDNIKNFSAVRELIAPAHKSSELKAALEQGKKIIITTIQKFPVIVASIGDLSAKRFAVIIDEAHSSQSGSAHDKMNQTMGQDSDAQDTQDQILEAMRARKMRGNASYFAFTATPKNTTLEKFGNQQPDGSFHPFHLYPMKQAIEEGFILDVLANYTTYRSYYEIQKSIAENPIFDSTKAQKKLRTYVEHNPSTIQAKAQIMLDHFITNVVKRKKLKGQARAMIITQDIESAIRYYQAIMRLLEQRGFPCKALVAFSGAKRVDGIEYTEADINGFPEDKTKEYFDGYDDKGQPIVHHGATITNTYRLLVVANKYLTGFDQPKLTAMYVDKRLQGVLCVQALSRLNRSAPKLGKRKEDLFVLDFFNSTDEIKRAFDDFYTATSLSEATDVNVLHELRAALGEVGVYYWQEVEDFIDKYFAGAAAQELSPIIDTAAQRFNSELEMEDDDKADFKIKAKQFVKIYGQMAAIMPFEVEAWEKLFWFLKFLIPKLIVRDSGDEQIDQLLESVDLSTYGLERVKLNQAIGLDPSATELAPQNPNPRGAHGDEDQDRLDAIIASFNERWFGGWVDTPEELRVKLINLANSISAHPDFASKFQNNTDQQNSGLAFAKIFDEVMMNDRRKYLELYRLWSTDPAFKTAMQQCLREMVEA